MGWIDTRGDIICDWCCSLNTEWDPCEDDCNNCPRGVDMDNKCDACSQHCPVKG